MYRYVLSVCTRKSIRMKRIYITEWQHLYKERDLFYIEAHALSNLLNELRKNVIIRGFPGTLSLFHNDFKKFNEYMTTNIWFYVS